MVFPDTPANPEGGDAGRLSKQSRPAAQELLITGMPPTIPDLYSDPEVVAENPYLSTHMQVYRKA